MSTSDEDGKDKRAITLSPVECTRIWQWWVVFAATGAAIVEDEDQALAERIKDVARGRAA